MASADMLRRVRAGQAPEATAHGYDNPRSFLEEFFGRRIPPTALARRRPSPCGRRP
jgi:hypothetical protein